MVDKVRDGQSVRDIVMPGLRNLAWGVFAQRNAKGYLGSLGNAAMGSPQRTPLRSARHRSRLSSPVSDRSALASAHLLSASSSSPPRPRALPREINTLVAEARALSLAAQEAQRAAARRPRRPRRPPSRRPSSTRRARPTMTIPPRPTERATPLTRRRTRRAASCCRPPRRRRPRRRPRSSRPRALRGGPHRAKSSRWRRTRTAARAAATTTTTTITPTTSRRRT